MALRALIMIEQVDSALKNDSNPVKSELYAEMKLDMVKAHAEFILLEFYYVKT